MKNKLGAKNLYYPSLTIIVGTAIEGKPNYETIAWGGILSSKILYFSSQISHYTNIGIHSNKTFSINIPSVKMVKETDFCGLHSGKTADKSKLFNSFYGRLENAPMISECPVNIECELFDSHVIDEHDIFIGKIAETYCDEEFMSNGKADLKKINPILFSYFDKSYWKIGERFADAMSNGKMY